MSDVPSVARLIKYFIMNNQGCTSKDISEFLISHDWGIRADYSSYKVGKLINNLLHKRNNSYVWFRRCVYVEKNGVGCNVYFVKE